MMTLNEVALLLTEPLVCTGVCDSPEQALKHIVLDYVERQIAQIEATLRGYERTYGKTFEVWTQALSGRASIADEDAWMVWEATWDVLEGWRGIRADIEQINPCKTSKYDYP